MSELRPDIQQALRTIHADNEPSAAQLQHIQARVLAVVAAPAALHASPESSVVLASKPLLWKALLVSTVLGAGVSALVLLAGPPSSRRAQPTSTPAMERPQLDEPRLAPALVPTYAMQSSEHDASVAPSPHEQRREHEGSSRAKRKVSRPHGGAPSLAVTSPSQVDAAHEQHQAPDRSALAMSPSPAIDVPPVAKPIATSATPPRATSDSLAEELALLSRAHQLLDRGNVQAALHLLGGHARNYPNGVLREEALATEVRCFCKSGSAEQARSALSRLLRIAPRSTHVSALRAVCGQLLVEK